MPPTARAVVSGPTQIMLLLNPYAAVVKKNAELTKEKNLRAKVTWICILDINLNFLIGEDYILH